MEIPTPVCALVRNDSVVRGPYFPLQIPNFSAQQNDTERVRLGTITDHARHDLAARPAGKFQFIRLLRKSNSPNTYYIVYKLDMYNSQHFYEFFVMRTGETGANCHENQTPLIPGRIGTRGRLRIRENHGSRENRCHRSVYSSRLIFRNRSGRQPPWAQTSHTSSGWNRPSPVRNDREFGKAAAFYFFAFYIIKETHPRVKRNL